MVHAKLKWRLLKVVVWGEQMKSHGWNLSLVPAPSSSREVQVDGKFRDSDSNNRKGSCMNRRTCSRKRNNHG